MVQDCGTNLVYNLKNKFEVILNFHNKKFFSKDLKYIKIINPKKIDIKEIEKKIKEINPKIIINCVANTDLEYCEIKPKDTEFPNSILPEILFKISFKNNIKFVHFSTDHLYSGGKKFKSEKEKTFTLNNYAKQIICRRKNN